MTLISLSLNNEDLKRLENDHFVGIIPEKYRLEIFDKIYNLFITKNFRVTLFDIINLFEIKFESTLYGSRNEYKVKLRGKNQTIFSVTTPTFSNEKIALTFAVKVVLRHFLDYLNKKLENIYKLEEKINKILNIKDIPIINKNIVVVVNKEFIESNSVDKFLEDVKFWMLCKYKNKKVDLNSTIIEFQGVTIKIYNTHINGLYELEKEYLNYIKAKIIKESKKTAQQLLKKIRKEKETLEKIISITEAFINS